MTDKKRKPFSVKRRLSKLEEMIDKRFSELKEIIDGKFDDLDGDMDHAIELLVELSDHVGVPDPSRDAALLRLKEDEPSVERLDVNATGSESHLVIQFPESKKP